MILVTGGTGFIGSYLLYYLLRDGVPVRATRRAGSSLKQTEFIFEILWHFKPLAYIDGWKNALNKIEWIEADVLDTDALNEAMQGIDMVYHAAATVSFDRRKRDAIIKNNAEGTANVVNLCIENNIKKLAYVSSVAAVNRKNGEVVDENAKIEDTKFTNAYSESKFRAEMEVWRGVAEGLDAYIINPGVVLGWGNFKTGSAAIIDKVARGLLFYPPGRNGFVDPRDVAEALIHLAKNEENKNKRYIAVAENALYKDLFFMIAKAINIKPPKFAANYNMSLMAWIGAEIKTLLSGKEVYLTRDVVDTACRNYGYSSKKITEETGFNFRPLQQTIEQTAYAYKIWRERNK